MRLQTEDAKWIYDNCARGTKITVYDGSSPGPLGKPDRLVDYIAPDHPARNWDPTDPRVENPWHALLTKYYTDSAVWAVENGIIDADFSPDEICTQAQVLTFLWRASGSPKVEGSPLPNVDEAYQGALLWAAGEGIIDLNWFDSGAPCTRAAAVSYIWKAFGRPKAGTAVSFTDVYAGADFAPAVAWAVENGITNGTGADTFSPYLSCTQAQILTFLYRAYQK